MEYRKQWNERDNRFKITLIKIIQKFYDYLIGLLLVKYK